MAKKGKRGTKPTDRSVSKTDKQTQSGVPGRRGTSRRCVTWSIGGLIVIMAVISAWAFLGNSSPNSPYSASANQSPAAASTEQTPVTEPAKKAGTDTINISGEPKIDFPEKSYDFGTIAQGSKASHTFKVRNTGDAPLRLIKAAGS